MATFRKPPDKKKQKEEKVEEATVALSEPRCKACQSDDRHKIDKLIALGTSYSEIERLTGISRQSLSNHAQRHLNYDDGAIRRIIESQSAKFTENYEEGVSGAVARRVYLEAIQQKAMEDLVTGATTIEVKDAINAVALMEKLESETSDAAIDEIRLQFSAILSAIAEIVPVEYHARVAERAREIAEADGFHVHSLERAIDAVAVDEDS